MTRFILCNQKSYQFIDWPFDGSIFQPHFLLKKYISRRMITRFLSTHGNTISIDAITYNTKIHKYH